MNKSQPKAQLVSVYVANPKDFHDLIQNISYLWFKKFGVNLTKSEIIKAGLRFARDVVAGKHKYFQLSLNESKSYICTKYGRLGR